MKVFKFGGASVKDATGVRNLAEIIKNNLNHRLFVVISAMGKTTNSLENVHAAYYNNDKTTAHLLLNDIKEYHHNIIRHLGIDSYNADTFFRDIEKIIDADIDTDFDRSYDNIVHYGEMISTIIVSDYITHIGLKNQWFNMPLILKTDNNHREANVLIEETKDELRNLLTHTGVNIHIAQGFVGGTENKEPTTLGREGSDYTAAVVANMIDAESVTIWKDVPGIMNADPKLFPDAIHIPELTYYDAVELAYSGAQIIHPKTIRPLENKLIPLFVKPFYNPLASGSVIRKQTQKHIDVPVYILKKNQVLITIRPKDFSFVLEPSLAKLFRIIESNKLKVSLIQSSAVTVSVCVDNSRNLDNAIADLQHDYNVTYNSNLQLLTIRGTTPDIIKQEEKNKDILLKQSTRRTIKLVYRD